MSVTLNEGTLLKTWHNLPEERMYRFIQLTRGYGVRRANVLKNTKRRAYAFNWMQNKMLPQAFRAPESTQNSILDAVVS